MCIKEGGREKQGEGGGGGGEREGEEGEWWKEVRGEKTGRCVCMCERVVADAHSSVSIYVCNWTKLPTDFMVQDGHTSFGRFL